MVERAIALLLRPAFRENPPQQVSVTEQRIRFEWKNLLNEELEFEVFPDRITVCEVDSYNETVYTYGETHPEEAEDILLYFLTNSRT